MAEIILEALDVEFSYTGASGQKALDKLNISIEKGKKVTVLGSNGAGKSTLLLHFNGILKPDKGRIRYGGKDVTYDNPSLRELRRTVGIVFQDPDDQLFSANVLQEVSFGPMNLGLTRQEVVSRVETAMAEMNIADLETKPTHMLSFGQKKRVAIACILAMEPEVIIFDEPTAWLDPRHARDFQNILERLNAEGKTIIISTHDVDLAYAWSDQIFVVQHGKVIGEGSPQQVFSQKELVDAADLTLPWLVDVHYDLLSRGLIAQDTPLPQCKEELLNNLSGGRPLQERL